MLHTRFLAHKTSVIFNIEKSVDQIETSNKDTSIQACFPSKKSSKEFLTGSVTPSSCKQNIGSVGVRNASSCGSWVHFQKKSARRQIIVVARRTLPSPAAAAATELLLRRSCCCDGAAAATELCSTSSVALILRSARRVSSLSDATCRRMRPAFISPRVDLNLKGRGPQS